MMNGALTSDVWVLTSLNAAALSGKIYNCKTYKRESRSKYAAYIELTRA